MPEVDRPVPWIPDVEIPVPWITSKSSPLNTLGADSLLDDANLTSPDWAHGLRLRARDFNRVTYRNYLAGDH